MSEEQKLAVRPRALTGKKVNRLRREGKLPGVIFGHGESVAVETDAHAFELGYRRWGATTLLKLEGLDGEPVSALVHGVARDPRSGKMIHIDFARVSLTEKTHAEVPLHFVGESPAVKTHGGVLVHVLDHVRVEAFPQDIPHSIEVDISAILELDHSLLVKDLSVDTAKVRILNDESEQVARVVHTRVEAEPTPAAAEAAEGEEEGEAEEAEAETKAEKKSS